MTPLSLQIRNLYVVSCPETINFIIENTMRLKMFEKSCCNIIGMIHVPALPGENFFLNLFIFLYLTPAGA